MYILTTAATENLVASYASRFQSDPNGEDYRFFSDDYGDGVACTVEQRDAYVAEFTLFVQQRTRFQILWLIGLVVLTVAVLVIGTFWVEWQPLIDFMERDDNLFPILGALLTAAPLIPAYRKGHLLYRKPVVELCTQRVATGRRHSMRVILHRRIRGMSDMMLGLMIIVPLAGIVINVLEINGGQRSAAAISGFAAMFIVGCAMVVLKCRGE